MISLDWDPTQGEKMGPAWAAVLDELSDYHRKSAFGWREWSRLIAVACDVNHPDGIVPRTASRMLYDGLAIGYLQQMTRNKKRYIKLTEIGFERWMMGNTELFLGVDD